MLATSVGRNGYVINKIKTNNLNKSIVFWNHIAFCLLKFYFLLDNILLTILNHNNLSKVFLNYYNFSFCNLDTIGQLNTLVSTFKTDQ